MTRNFERFDSYDYDAASLVELAILLEDAIDMHDRHWSIHWVLNFAQFSSTTNLNTVIAEVKGEGDHSALIGPAAVLDGEPQLGLHRGAVEDQGGREERRRCRRGGLRRVHRRRRCDQGARVHRGGPVVPGQGDRGLPGRVRLQVDVRPRVLLQDLARGPGPGASRPSAATWRPTTTTRPRSPPSPRTSRPPRPRPRGRRG